MGVLSRVKHYFYAKNKSKESNNNTGNLSPVISDYELQYEYVNSFRYIINNHIKTLYNENRLDNRLLDIIQHDTTVVQALQTLSNALNGLGYCITMENGAKLNNKTKFLNTFLDGDTLNKGFKDKILAIAFQTALFGNACVELDYSKDEIRIPQNLKIMPFNKVQVDKENHKIYWLKSSTKTYLNPYVYLRYENNEIFLNENGDSLLFDIAPLVILKQGSLNMWDKMLGSNSYPTKVLKTNGITDVKRLQALNKKLESLLPQSIIIGQQDSYEQHIMKPETEGHKQFYEILDKEITKMIAGQNLTSSEGKSGSYALGQVHKQVLDARTQSFAKFSSQIFTNLLNTILLVNGINDRVIFAFNDIVNLNQDLALRDETLYKQGVRHTKEYYIRKYGFEEDEITITTEDSIQNNAKDASNKLKLASEHTLFTKEQQGIEELNEIAIDEHTTGFAVELLKMIKKSTDKDELLANFAELMQNYDHEQDFKQLHNALISADIYGYANEKLGE